MTNEEAINVLNDYDINFERHTAEEVAEAHEIAIKVLQQQPSENEKIIRISKGTLKARTGRYVIYDVEWLKTHFNTTEAKIYGQPNEDCISRDATLTAFSDYVGGGMSMNDFDAMWDIVVKMPPVEPKPKTSEDYISRQAVLEITAETGALETQTRVKALPSVTPQQKTGHWIGHREHCEKLGVIPSGLGVYEWCSNCGHGIDIRDWSRISHNYCPKCGAKMQEVQK